jgi:hypothetical protein
MANDSFGYGQLAPSDSTHRINVTEFHIRQVIAEMNTMKLVQVMKVTGGGVAPAGTVDVLPLVSQIDGNRNITKHGIVPGIPWSRVQGGANAIICDPAVGDIGYVVASDRDISAVKNTMPGGAVPAKGFTPGSLRTFDIADGVYAGGCLNITPTQYVIFTATGIRIVDLNGNMVTMSSTGIALVGPGGNEVQITAAGTTITGPLIVTGSLLLGGGIESEAGGTYAGNFTTTGTITGGTVVGGGKNVATHEHGGVTTGGGTTGPPI